MADVSKIKLTDNTEYDIKDAIARQSIATTDEKTDEIIEQLNNPTYTTTEGTDLTINNTRVGKMKFRYGGGIEQESTNGYNLLPYQEFVTKTISGVTFTNNNDGTYTVNGTATADASVVVYDTFMAMSGTWRMLGCPTGGSASTYMLSAYVGYWGEGSPNIDTGNGTNITYTGNVKIRFYIKNGTTCNNLIFKPMLTTNTSLTINDFEPYTGGIASPNPDYQQEVKIVTGENTIDIVGKNFFDVGNSLSTWFQTADNGIKVNYNIVNRTTATINGNKLTVNSYDNTGWTWISKWIKLKPNTTYTISGTNTQGIKIVGFNSQEIASTGTLISTKAPNNTFITFNTGNYNYYALSLYPAGADNYIENIQIEIGSTASTYEEYKSQSYEINLGANLFNIQKFWKESKIGSAANGLRYYLEQNNTIYITGTPTNYSGCYGRAYSETEVFMTAKANHTYRILIKLSNKVSNIETRFYIGTTSHNDWNITEMTSNGVYIKDYTPTSDINFTQFSIIGAAASNTSPITAVMEIAIYDVTNVDIKTYQPYFEPIELCDIEEHQEYIYDNGGKWFKHKEVGKKILNGTENWNTASQNYPVFNVGVFTDKVSGQGNFKCNNFSYLGNAQTTLLGYAMSFNTDTFSQYMYIQVPSSVVSQGDVTAFKSWLSANTTTVYYPLKVSEEEEITEPTLINQLNAIKYGAESYYGQTNIMITSEELQPTLKVQTMDKIV